MFYYLIINIEYSFFQISLEKNAQSQRSGRSEAAQFFQSYLE